jgi:hypothetical protein
MPSVTYKPLKALAVGVIAIYSRARRKRRKPDSMTTAPLVKPLYTLDELAELRRHVLRYARSFPPGYERNKHLQVAVSLRRLFKNETWLDAHIIKGPQSASTLAGRSAETRWRLRRPAFLSRNRSH